MLFVLLITAVIFSSTNGRQWTSDCAADFLFVVDGSSSVRSEFRPQLDFIEEIVTKLTVRPDAHRVALIQYSSAKKMRTEFEFDTYLDQNKIEGAIRTLPYMTGITETSLALTLAKEVLKKRRTNVPTFVIVVTDGRSRRDPTEAAKSLHGIPGAHTYAVGISDDVDMDELQTIATNPDSAYLGNNAAQKLIAKFRSYLNCPETTTTSTTTTTTTTATTTTKATTTTRATTRRTTRQRTRRTTRKRITTKRTTYRTTRARITTTTTGPPVPVTPRATVFHGEAPECQFDVLLIIDSSGSETSSYGHELEHAVEYVRELEIGPDSCRVAQVRYASQQKQFIDFPFDEIYDKSKLISQISSSHFSGGSTRTDMALELAAKVIQDDSYGRRIGKVPLYVIMFTDGYTLEESRVAKAAEAMRRLADRTIVIGVTPGTPYYALLDIIAGGEGKAYTVNRVPSHKEFGEEWKHLTSKCK